jgi:hypothetical protein
MARLLALGIFVAGAAADAGLRGRHAQRDPSFDSLFGKSDSSSDNADPMDMYIKTTKSDAGSNVWWSSSDSKKDKSASIFDHPADEMGSFGRSTKSVLDHSDSSASSIFDDLRASASGFGRLASGFGHHSASSSSDLDAAFKSAHASDNSDAAFKSDRVSDTSDAAFKSDRVSDTSDAAFKSDHTSDTSDAIFKPSRSSFPADDEMRPAKKASVAMPRSAPTADDNASGGGAVIDIKLDSELQETQSLLQTSHKAAGAPDVEAAVASQRLQDVYIHDQFSQAAAADTKQEQEVKADHNMKA